MNTLRWYRSMDLCDVMIEDKPTDKTKVVNPAMNGVTSRGAAMAGRAHFEKDAVVEEMSVRENVNEYVYADKLDGVTTLEDLRSVVMEFDGCALKYGAKNTVFSDGVSSAKIMLIGEAPGASEDEQGIPFCGDSGKLLDAMLKSIGISRNTNCYISNTVFWRPPANRVPTDEEIEICRPFVEKHIALINPTLLILVGSTAVSSLLGKHMKISKIRQEYYLYSNRYMEHPVNTTAIFHPAYLLRQPLQKKATWYDLLRIKNFVGVHGIDLSSSHKVLER